MYSSVYEHAGLIDTSAVLAVLDPRERFHGDASAYFEGRTPIAWASLNVTAHEAYTRARYNGSTCKRACAHFDFLRQHNIRLLEFSAEDEAGARQLLLRYSDQRISFHDALCAVVMQRLGIYKVFSFDRDFLILGFELLPGIYA
jgi:predicted nucleic acid-binding protein